jgi:hypothetical protein
MIGPVHPEMLRELQHDRRQDIDRALRGCRRAERRRGERR